MRGKVEHGGFVLPSAGRGRPCSILYWAVAAVIGAVCFLPVDAQAAKIGDLVTTTVLKQALDFFTFREPAVRYALLGSMLLGISCGLLGSFIVVRKMALVGDA